MANDVSPVGTTQLDYAEKTSVTGCTATTEATATTIVTGNPVLYSGNLRVCIEFWCPYCQPANQNITFVLYDGASSIGLLGNMLSTTTQSGGPIKLERWLTPSVGSHTYSIRGFVNSGTVNVGAGVGGLGAYFPAFMRIFST